MQFVARKSISILPEAVQSQLKSLYHRAFPHWLKLTAWGLSIWEKVSTPDERSAYVLPPRFSATRSESASRATTSSRLGGSPLMLFPISF